MKYVVICLLRDTDHVLLINKWISEAGGHLPLAELERKFRGRFGFFRMDIIYPEAWASNPAWQQYVPYVLENGNVSELPKSS